MMLHLRFIGIKNKNIVDYIYVLLVRRTTSSILSIDLIISPTHIQLINIFSYSITTHFIPSNKYYNSFCNFHSVYQMCHKCCYSILNLQ